jgi:hypothetical protein
VPPGNKGCPEAVPIGRGTVGPRRPRGGAHAELLAGRPIRIAGPRAKSRLHERRPDHSGARDRRKHSAFLGRQRGAAPSAALSGAGPAPLRLHADRAVSEGGSQLSELPRLAARQRRVLGARRLPFGRLQPHRVGGGGAVACRHGLLRVLSAARGPAAGRPDVQGRRGPTRRRAGRDPRRWALEAQIGRRPGRSGKDDHTQRKALHHRGGGAGPPRRFGRRGRLTSRSGNGRTRRSWTGGPAWACGSSAA